MSAPAFTPGPWIVTGDLQDGYLRIRDAGSEEVLAMMDDRGHCDPKFAIDDAVIEANARLIAAAPELYEALEPLLGIIDEGVSCNISDKELREAHPDDRSFIMRTRKAVATAKAALARARGEEVAK